MKRLMPLLSMLLVAAVTMTMLTVAVKADGGSTGSPAFQAGDLVYGDRQDTTMLEGATGYTVFFENTPRDMLFIKDGDQLRIAYCYSPRLYPPEKAGTSYYPPDLFDGQEYDPALQAQIRAILSAGFPIDAQGFRAKCHLNSSVICPPQAETPPELAQLIGDTFTKADIECSFDTQIAIWAILNGDASDMLQQAIKQGTDDQYRILLLKEALNPSPLPGEKPDLIDAATGEAPAVAFGPVEGESEIRQTAPMLAKGYAGILRFTGLPEGLSVYILEANADGNVTYTPAGDGAFSTSHQFVFRCDAETAEKLETDGYLSFTAEYSLKTPGNINYYKCTNVTYQNLLSYDMATEETSLQFPVTIGEEPPPAPVIEYTVTYHENGGDPSTIPAKETKLPEGPHTLVQTPEPKRGDQDGYRYTFQGWSLDPNDPEHLLTEVELNENTAPPEERNVDVYAIWKTEKITYNIYYDANGGDPDSAPLAHTKLDPGTYDLSKKEPTHPPAADGTAYDFKGWGLTPTATPSESIRSVTIVDRDVTVYAIWEKHSDTEAPPDPTPPTPEPPNPTPPTPTPPDPTPPTPTPPDPTPPTPTPTPTPTPSGGENVRFNPPVGDESVDFPPEYEAISDERIPLDGTDQEDVTDILDEAPPLAMIPQTGDNSSFGFAAALLALSLGGMAALAMVLRRLSQREREEG